MYINCKVYKMEDYALSNWLEINRIANWLAKYGRAINNISEYKIGWKGPWYATLDLKLNNLYILNKWAKSRTANSKMSAWIYKSD
jgi:hypothetical protein